MDTLEYLDTLGLPKTSDDLEEMDALHEGQCCDCVYDDGHHRVWICRCERGVTVESNINGRWRTVSGGCMDPLD